MTSLEPRRRTPRFVLACIGVGLAAGLLSGLFGVGGGTVIVPMLVLILAYGQKLASGTSLADMAAAIRMSFVTVALWWLLFMLPLMENPFITTLERMLAPFQ